MVGTQAPELMGVCYVFSEAMSGSEETRERRRTDERKRGEAVPDGEEDDESGCSPGSVSASASAAVLRPSSASPMNAIQAANRVRWASIVAKADVTTSHQPATCQVVATKRQ